MKSSDRVTFKNSKISLWIGSKAYDQHPKVLCIDECIECIDEFGEAIS